MQKLLLLFVLIAAIFYGLQKTVEPLPDAPASGAAGPAASGAPAAPAEPVVVVAPVPEGTTEARACLVEATATRNGVAYPGGRLCTENRGQDPTRFRNECGSTALVPRQEAGAGYQVNVSYPDACPLGEIGSCTRVREEFVEYFYEAEGEQTGRLRQSGPSPRAKLEAELCRYRNRENYWRGPREAPGVESDQVW